MNSGPTLTYIQVEELGQARNQYETGAKQNSAFYLTLKMEGTYASETGWVDIRRNTLRYVPERVTLHSPRCQNLKST
jgi:hypothetical protein